MDLEFTEKLLQAVRNRPVWYLINHPDYKNNTKKLQALRDIQRELNEEDSFKKLSKRTQVNVKFDIAKILMEAELNDLETAERNTSSRTSNYSNDMTIHAPATPGTHWGSNTSSHTTTYSSMHAPVTQNDSEAAHQDSYDSNTTNIHALVTPGNYSLIKATASTSSRNVIGPQPSTSVDITNYKLNDIINQENNKSDSEPLASVLSQLIPLPSIDKGKGIGKKHINQEFLLHTRGKVPYDESALENIEIPLNIQKNTQKERDQSVCTICLEEGILREIWYRCRLCAGWAHEACTGCDDPNRYRCDFCI
ncbi:unnamed protein product [Parnassius apollo]|uniref:(apollo) hypothetical protein n=1 Tax=Parnassius apollo TaxID=110799 RepID=A0A8S3WDS4_PARAO|nr:unnamed protein product [Parnassius apollo]